MVFEPSYVLRQSGTWQICVCLKVFLKSHLFFSDLAVRESICGATCFVCMRTPAHTRPVYEFAPNSVLCEKKRFYLRIAPIFCPRKYSPTRFPEVMSGELRKKRSRKLPRGICPSLQRPRSEAGPDPTVNHLAEYPAPSNLQQAPMKRVRITERSVDRLRQQPQVTRAIVCRNPAKNPSRWRKRKRGFLEVLPKLGFVISRRSLRWTIARRKTGQRGNQRASGLMRRKRSVLGR